MSSRGPIERRGTLGRMKFAILFGALVAPLACHAARFEPARCAPVGFMAADNDIRLDNDHRPPAAHIHLPKPIDEKVRALAVKLLAGVDSSYLEGLTCDMVDERVYQINQHRVGKLYVADVSFPLGPNFFFLILFDKATGEITENPPRIGSKWPDSFGAQDVLVHLPVVSSTDMFGNGTRQIVFQERVHNGNVYNAIIYHYFEIGSQAQLTRVIARETRLIDIVHEHSEYVRSLDVLSPTYVRVFTYRQDLEKPSLRSLMGYAVLTRPQSGIAFHVAERHPSAGVNLSSLVTDCEISDDDFLRGGCDFYY